MTRKAIDPSPLRRKSGIRRCTIYALAGAALAAGAPLGLLVLRASMATEPLTLGWIPAEIRADPALYLYLLIATTTVLSGVGAVIGRYEGHLKIASETDALTALPNRRTFDEALERELARARRYGSALTILLVDIDDFKRVNDEIGHAGGDAALRLVAENLRNACRATDVAARCGGDEFAILLPETTGEGGLKRGQRLVESQRGALQLAPGAPSLTLSIGVAERAENDDAHALMRRADRALYQAKSAGRNRAILGMPEPTV